MELVSRPTARAREELLGLAPAPTQARDVSVAAYSAQSAAARLAVGDGGGNDADLSWDSAQVPRTLAPNRATMSTSSGVGTGLHPSSCNSLAVGACISEAPTRRLYELWPQLGGRNQFYCGGRCITGPPHDNGYNACAWVCIVVPVICYYAICAKYLWDHVSPLLPLVTGIALVASVAFMLLTSCTDPGIIPRHGLQLAVPGLADQVATAIGAQPLFADPVTAEPVCTLTEQEGAMGYRWCPTCKVVRPPRASHCRDCDNCVLRFDHHCPFVNNCVGQRNYAFFSGFIVSTSCLGFAVVVGAFIHISHFSDDSDTQPISPQFLNVLLAIIGVPCVFLLVGVVLLSCFHTYLVLSGRTTKEALTGKGSMRGRTLSMVRGPSLIHTRALVRA